MMFFVESSESEDETTHSDNVGTYLYTSPEGHKGEKCDIYSLGIILFEVGFIDSFVIVESYLIVWQMFFRFNTRMERALVLQKLRKNCELPAAFSAIPEFVISQYQ